jgi:tetratricopeptide (TPR) repeat protein
MNKKIIYPLIISLFIVSMSFIIFQFTSIKDEEINYQLKERKGALAGTEEYKNTRATAARLKMAIQENSADHKSMLGLAALYIQEGRITGDYMYYNPAAMQQVNNVLKADSNNFQALTYKALIYLSQHHFSDGLVVAEKAKSINPYNAFIYGILIDANVEMGDYTAAVGYADQMVSIRPDIRSYSRISYLRELHGDMPGAIDAMKMAVDAGMPGDEGTEWARIQLGHLYENIGDLRNAEMHYRIALQERPDYPYALAGLAHIESANKNYGTAINYLLKAESLVNDYSFKEELVDLYKLSGNQDKSIALAKAVIDGMNKDAESGLKNENLGHYADRELAYAYLKMKQDDKALSHAMTEYERRPKNIDVNETVAWVLYNDNKPAQALPYLKEALKTNNKNPTLLCRAGLIYAKTGEKAKAKTFLSEAFKNNPNISQELRAETITVMNSL